MIRVNQTTGIGATTYSHEKHDLLLHHTDFREKIMLHYTNFREQIALRAQYRIVHIALRAQHRRYAPWRIVKVKIICERARGAGGRYPTHPGVSVSVRYAGVRLGTLKHTGGGRGAETATLPPPLRIYEQTGGHP